MEGKVAIQPVKRVLIFDSDQVFALGLAHFLRNHGWEAIVARGSDEDVAPAWEGGFVLVDICDNGVPDCRRLSRLRALHPECRIVAVTAYPSVTLVVAAIRHGADDCLLKPVTPGEVLSALCDDAADSINWGCVLPSLGQIEWEYISRVLRRFGGNISVAARVLGIRRTTLQRRLRKYPPRWPKVDQADGDSVMRRARRWPA